MGTVIGDADETLFWLEMIEESGVINDLRFRNDDSINSKSTFKNPQSEILDLKKEANELVSIFVASVKTVKNRLNQKS